MHYLDEGEGEPIVMVHGNPTWSYYFRHLVALLSPSHRVIVPDHIGCGLSDKPQHYDYCLDTHITNLQRLIDHLGLKRFSLVVHDWGGAIGLGSATLAPDRIERIVVTNSAAFRSTKIPLRIRVCRWPGIGSLIVRGLNGFSGAAVHMAVSIPLDKEIARAYIAPYDSWQNRVAVHAFVADIPLTPKDRSYDRLVRIEEGLADLRDRKIPMMLLWGGADFCFTRHFFDEWQRRFPTAEHHYFADGGHYILEDKRTQVAPLISTFLQGPR